MSQALRISASFSGLSSTMNREGVPRKRFSSHTRSRKGCGCPQKSYKGNQAVRMHRRKQGIGYSALRDGRVTLSGGRRLPCHESVRLSESRIRHKHRTHRQRPAKQRFLVGT